MLVIVLGAAMTWMLPAGRYDLLRYDQANRTFVAQRATGEETLPAKQATLDQLGIQIQIEHFEKGNIRKPVAIPGTYHTVTASSQGVIAILKAPVLGTYEAIDGPRHTTALPEEVLDEVPLSGRDFPKRR
jgi:uncharacterized ion transporter superfamily protein YfcC